MKEEDTDKKDVRRRVKKEKETARALRSVLNGEGVVKTGCEMGTVGCAKNDAAKQEEKCIETVVEEANARTGSQIAFKLFEINEWMELTTISN